MSRELVFQAEYGVIGAGTVSKSLIGLLSAKTRRIGPVAAVSFRVASRIANSLRAGRAVRTTDEFRGVSAILFHAPPDYADTLSKLLLNFCIEWPLASVLFCDCDPSPGLVTTLRTRGASVATVRRFGQANRIVMEGDETALQHAHRIAQDVKCRAAEIHSGTGDLFDAAITLGTASLTPLVDRAAAWLRECGMRRTEAVAIITEVFEKTIRDYAHSGRQSWAWHVRSPEPERIETQIARIDAHLQSLMRQLVLLGFEENGKHPEIATRIRNPK